MLYRPRPFDLVDGKANDDFVTATALGKATHDVGARLVIVDVLRAAARFKENEQSEFARVRDAIEPLLAAGRTVLLLHHFGKLSDTQQQRSPGERMAGHWGDVRRTRRRLPVSRGSESGARRLQASRSRRATSPHPTRSAS